MEETRISPSLASLGAHERPGEVTVRRNLRTGKRLGVLQPATRLAG